MSPKFPRTKVVNSTEIVKYLESVPDADNKSECVVIMFYYPWDYYSVQVALHYNALGRYYPHLHVLAFNAYNHNGINMRFGLVGVPTILFLQNGKAIGKLSEDIRLMSIDSLAEFIWKLSGLRPSANPMVHKEDYFGPLPIRVVKQPDYALYLSWFFVIVSTLGYLISNASRLGYLTKINDWLRTTWRDANAHHEHLD
ncbi:Thioredoxin domain-containing protein 15 [Halotydeus destructor]|nr:Thioredoxin domain-containing protein 15 [Halotydeus destructor]